MVPRTHKKPTTEESVTQKKAPVAQAGKPFDWAINGIKLQRAQNWVRNNETTKALTGEEAEQAIKDRYIAMGGLVEGDTAKTSKAGSTVVNLADDDGDTDVVENDGE